MVLNNSQALICHKTNQPTNQLNTKTLVVKVKNITAQYKNYQRANTIILKRKNHP